MIDCLNLLTKALNTGRSIAVIVLDMTKAFDRIYHRRSPNKMKSHSILGPILSWFSSFLSSRNWTVQVNGSISEPRLVTSDIIQGSILGPPLFLLCVTDVFEAIRNGVPLFPAEDVKIVYTFHPKTLESTSINMIQDLSSFNFRAYNCMMKFSAGKSSLMRYKCITPLRELKPSEQIIPVSGQICNLWLHYSCSLNFLQHALIKVEKANKLVGLPEP